MKKLLVVTLVTVCLIACLCACDLKHEQTVNEKTTTDVTGNDHPGSTHLWHAECEYCGKLDGENRWFIAEVISASMVKPLGQGCFEAISAGEAGISLNVSGFAVGDIVRITYGGYIMESYPVQIHADSIEPVK